MRRAPGRTWGALGLATAMSLACVTDGLLGTGALVGHPATLILAAGAGLALGAWVPVRLAVIGVLAIDVTWTFATQRHFPGDYPILDDLVFGLLIVGAPALAGAMLVARRAQVRELSSLSHEVARQRADDLAAARLEEQHRIEAAVHRHLVEHMGAIALRAEGAAHEPSPPVRDAAIADVERAAHAGLEELRQAIGLLRTRPAMEGNSSPPPRPTPIPAVGVADLALALGLAVALAVESVIAREATGPAWSNILVSLLMTVPLVWRRQHPVVATAAGITVATVASPLLTPFTSMVTALGVLLVQSYSIGAYARRWGRAVGGLVLVIGWLTLVRVTPVELRDPSSLAPTLIWCLLPLGAGALVAGWSRRAGQLQHAVRELERTRDADLRMAVAQRRSEMSRDLHDSVAHTLTAVYLGAAAARRGAPPAETLLTLARVAREGMGELRRGINAIEPVDLRADAAHGMARALGVEFTLSDAGTRLPLDHPLLRRVLREALVNAARHAPGARVDARFDRVGDGIRLIITDEGAVGAAHSSLGSGSGLKGLSSLLDEHGGHLQYGPRPGGGFRIEAMVPIAGHSAGELRS